MNRLIKIIASLLFLGIIIVIFSGFKNYSYKITINNLLDSRINILQNSYYNKIDLEETENTLSSIEAAPLLISDLESIINLESTEVDIVKSFKITKIKKIKEDGDFLTFLVGIKWDMQGTEGPYSSTLDYILVIKKDNNDYKLTDYYLSV